MSRDGLYGDDPREEEFLAAIKSVERARNWFPLFMFGFFFFDLWWTGGGGFQRPGQLTAFPFLIYLGVIMIGVEVLNLKVLLLKSEYRDWLRDFRAARWKDMNDD